MGHLLEVSGVCAGYGRIEVLHDVDLAVPAGSVVALLGPNGAGKTTTLRTIAGALPLRRGRIRLDGRRLDGLAVHRVAGRGVTLIPEGRGIFPALTVAENLEVAVRSQGGPPADRSSARDRILATFPRLAERRDQVAGSLSGGEQQMLALGRALVGRPKLLLLDEISMGLAPIIVEQLFEIVARLRDDGLTILLVEQYLTYALRFADICYVLSKGRVVFVGEPAELRDESGVAASYLGG